MIGEELRMIRLSKHMTQEDVANKAGVSLPTISSLEKGRTQGTLKCIGKVAKALNVELKITFDEV